MMLSVSVGSHAPTYSSLADPPTSSVLLPAVSWLQGTLLGSLATLTATIAIASVGFMMLTGRLSVRPGIAVIVGSFILVGASTVAAGIQGSISSSIAASYAPPVPQLPSPGPEPVADPSPPATDPHAGASLLER
jgi:type IV secretory pathway VirB2 component (pilin)